MTRGAATCARTSATSGSPERLATQRRVAAMAAEGMTNREVALALFVYPAAVDIAAG